MGRGSACTSVPDQGGRPRRAVGGCEGSGEWDLILQESQQGEDGVRVFLRGVQASLSPTILQGPSLASAYNPSKMHTNP